MATPKPKKAEVAKLYVAWIRAGATPEEQVKRGGIAQSDLLAVQQEVSKARAKPLLALVEEHGASEVARRTKISRTRVIQLLG